MGGASSSSSTSTSTSASSRTSVNLLSVALVGLWVMRNLMQSQTISTAAGRCMLARRLEGRKHSHNNRQKKILLKQKKKRKKTD